MKFGILLPIEGNVTDGSPNSKLAIRVAERAEELAFDSVWAGERLLLSPRLDPISLLGAVASRTETVRLGTAVIIAPLRSPVLTANQLSSLDNISDGRVIAGFGVGAERIRSEFENVGVPFNERGKRLDECIELVKKIWSGEDVSFEGRYYHVKNLQMKLRPKQRGGPPIFLGGTKNVSIKRIGKLADGWMPLEISPAEYDSTFEKIISSQRPPVRPLEKALYITLNISETRESAKKEAQIFVETYYNAKFPAIEKMAFFGTTKDCISRFEEYASSGVETAIVRFASFRDQIKEIESFNKEIASRF